MQLFEGVQEDVLDEIVDFRAWHASEQDAVYEWCVKFVESRESLAVTLQNRSDQHDFDRLQLRETLERLLARHIHVSVVGIGIDIGVRSHRYIHQPWVPYGTLPRELSNLDIGIAPLVDMPFNRARSNVKLKEYAASGLAWLASPIGPYAELGEEQGGRLVADGDWYGAIEQLVLDGDARSRLAHRARRWAAGERIEGHVELWEQTFEDAIARTRAPAAG